MVRRRSTKSRGQGRGQPRPTNRSDSKIRRWNKLSDIPVDDEDQFHISRDEILLEGGGHDGDDDDDENEVFGLKGISEDEGGDDEGGDDEEEDDEREGDENVEDIDGSEGPPAQKNETPPKRPKKKKVAESSGSSPESEAETWGRGKSAYYSSNAADIESDDEEANELEEQEAKRLQAKAREAMVEDDFGLHDAVQVEPGKGETDDLMDPPSPVLQALPQDVSSYVRHLEKNSPETLALARDWEDTAQSVATLSQKVADLDIKGSEVLSLRMSHLHYQAHLTYATTLAFYLHLRSSEKYAQHPKMLESHPILSRLLTLKQSLNTLEELDFATSDNEDGEDDEDDEDDDYHEEAISVDEDDDAKPQPTLTTQPILATEQPPKKKRKTSTESQNPLFDLVEPVFKPSKQSSTSRSNSGIMDPYGESTSLQHADAADKSARRKTLRFHTAKIESASARRQGARANAAGGDDDLPYRERRKEKEIRLANEAKAKIRGQGGEDLDNVDPEPRQQQKDDGDGDGGEEGGGEEGEDGYYELIKKKSKEKKAQKKAQYEAAQAASRPDLNDAVSGPRSLTRAILANKGLTPHRPKSVRNPRVKKRIRFEKAKKKVSSQKAVYKGGIGATGRYDGEKSGISKVVKSVRLA